MAYVARWRGRGRSAKFGAMTTYEEYEAILSTTCPSCGQEHGMCRAATTGDETAIHIRRIKAAGYDPAEVRRRSPMDVKGMMRREGINRRLRSEGVLPPLPDPAIRQAMALEDERVKRAEAEAQPVEPDPAQQESEPAYQYPPEGEGGPGDGPPEGMIGYPFPIVDEVRAERALGLALALLRSIQTYRQQVLSGAIRHV